MFIRFVVPHVDPSGGFWHAMCRLAVSLAEKGHKCEVGVPPSLNAPATIGDGAIEVRTLCTLKEKGSYPLADGPSMQRAFAAGQPDILVVGEGRHDVLDAARRVAPTVLHAQVSSPACPDSTRYWHRVGRACSVRAGLKCLALRPILGCSTRTDVLTPRPVMRWQRLNELLVTGSVGIICVSGPQAVLMREHGVPDHALAVIPNLGMRMEPAQIAKAAAAVPDSDRSATAYFGRLSKGKGALLLPALAAAAPPPGLRVFGEGYLADRLSSSLGTSLRGHVPQSQVAGVMAWARSTVFPSQWPEPGGIVGIDAQLFGVPLGSFAVGAALDWPVTQQFPPGDGKSMAEWVASQPPVVSAREAEIISARQEEYWQRVSERASHGLESFVATGRFPPVDINAVGDDLTSALGATRLGQMPN